MFFYIWHLIINIDSIKKEVSWSGCQSSDSALARIILGCLDSNLDLIAGFIGWALWFGFNFQRDWPEPNLTGRVIMLSTRIQLPEKRGDIYSHAHRFETKMSWIWFLLLALPIVLVLFFFLQFILASQISLVSGVQKGVFARPFRSSTSLNRLKVHIGQFPRKNRRELRRI